jgi:glycosyltransferase involved in cell wall biosynthesis
LLHVLSSVEPSGGGPLEGVRERGLKLIDLGHSVELATLDDPAESFVTEFPLPVHALGPPHTRYRYSPKLVPWLEKHAARFDAVVVNGLWQYHSFAAWRALRRIGMPYFVFTHGMLDPWFKRTYPVKHLKKWMFWPWADYRVLRDAAAVLFTSEEERLQARRSFWLYRAEERVVAYGTRSPPEPAAPLRAQFLARHPELQGRRVLLFLGRIHEKKGCDLLIEAFARCAEADDSLHLLMAGPDQSGWGAQLKMLARRLGIESRISWPGLLRGDAKWGAFYSAEAFILPSHQENFGIAVAEALGCSLPVLISDKVNIWREVQAHRAGLVAPDTLAGTRALLEQWLEMPRPQRLRMREQACELFRCRFTVDAMAASLLEIVTARPVSFARTREALTP